MQKGAIWNILEHFWAKIGLCKHGGMRMDEFEDKRGYEHAKNLVKQIQVARRDKFLEGLTKTSLKTKKFFNAVGIDSLSPEI